MKTADTAYLTEEAKLRGATPAVRAVINIGKRFGTGVKFGTGVSFGASEITPAEIIKGGRLATVIPQAFQAPVLSPHHLLLNNRTGAWLRSVATSPGKATDLIRLDHGFRQTDGTYVWLPVFTGSIKKAGNLLHEWGKGHNAVIESLSPLQQGLQKKIGIPATDGARQPFMHGPYLANCELVEVTDPYLSAITKTGTGKAVLHVLNADKYSFTEDLDFRLQAESTGEIGTVTFKYSTDGGMTWERTGLVTKGIMATVNLEHNLKVYWTGALGNDFVSGDHWDFTAFARVHHWEIPGYPFASISAVFKNEEEIATGLTITPATGTILDTGSSGRLKARVVKDTLTHPVDIIQDILTEVGLSEYIHALSFAQAKDDTPEYAIGVRFENVSAAKAIQLITQNCLYFFWEDFGLLHLQAYTGSL